MGYFPQTITLSSKSIISASPNCPTLHFTNAIQIFQLTENTYVEGGKEGEAGGIEQERIWRRRDYNHYGSL